MHNIIFDIETGPLPEEELVKHIPEFDPSEVKTGNIKDPLKIEAKIEECRLAHEEGFREKAALDAMAGRVIAIGVILGEGSPEILSNDDEAALLKSFWDLATEVNQGIRVHPLIGFNIAGFDLPFLYRRSWKHKVAPPALLRRGRYWSEQVIDLREIWQLGDRQARGSLDAVCKHLGLGEKNGDGKDFAALWASDREKAIAYLKNDLELTRKLAEALGVH